MSVTRTVPTGHAEDPLDRVKVVAWRVPAVDATALEAVTLPAEAEADALQRVKEATGAVELVYLPTCQRVLLTLNTPDAPERVQERVRDAFVAARKADVPAPEVFHGFEAFAHLSEVAASLDSLVPGETQILGQMKDAYKHAQEAGFVGQGGRGLTHVFPLVFRTAKAVRTDTDLFKGKVSLIPLTLDVVTEHLGAPAGSSPRLVIVGTGTMGRKMADLTTDAVPDVAVTHVSRDAQRGVSLDAFLAAPPAADVVAFATRTERPFFTREHAERLLAAQDGAPLLLIDLSVPRCVADSVRDVAGVTLVSLDDLTRLSEDAKQERREELDRARTVLDRELDRVATEYAKLPTQRALATYRRAMEDAAEERYTAGAEKWREVFDDPEFRKWFEQTTRHLAHVAQERLHDARVKDTVRRIRPTERDGTGGR